MIKSICFLTTYNCNARCSYCECGPRERDRLSLEDMKRLTDEGVALGTVGQIVFSGGEPTLLGDDLFEGIAYAHSRRLLTRVVTNGFWGKSPEAAAAFVDRLIAAGLTEINISVDDLHQKYVPFWRVKNAFLACYDRQFPCLIAHKQDKDSVITRAYLEREFGVELITFEPGRRYTREENRRLISTGSVIPITREAELADPEQMLSSNWRSSCSSVLRDIIVGARGNFLPCCGIVTKDLPELTRHNLREHSLLEAIDDANSDLLLNWLALEGPAAIADFVHELDPSVEFRDRYAGICHICNDVLARPEVRQVLTDNIDRVRDRVSMHRALLEAARQDEELMQLYARV
jgi:organic radical activating enzyme